MIQVFMSLGNEANVWERERERERKRERNRERKRLGKRERKRKREREIAVRWFKPDTETSP